MTISLWSINAQCRFRMPETYILTKNEPMINTNFKYLLLLTMSLSIFSACDDDDEPVIVDEPKVQFDFADPVAGSIYQSDDTVFINGMISFENDMHGYEVSLINKSHNDTMVFNKNEELDGKMIHVHAHWVNNVDHHSDMTLTIDALTDHSGTKQTKTIDFHCHPK